MYVTRWSLESYREGIMRNIILMTIAFVFFLIVMSMYSISNQAYGHHIATSFAQETASNCVIEKISVPEYCRYVKGTLGLPKKVCLNKDGTWRY